MARDGEAGFGGAVGWDESMAVGGRESSGEEVCDDAGLDYNVVAVLEGGDEAALERSVKARTRETKDVRG